MSYEPTIWKSGDTVTSMKLNKMEQGIASSSTLIVHGTDSAGTITLDKTWKEIQEAMQEKIVCIYSPDSWATIHLFVAETFFNGSYGVNVFTTMPDGSINNTLFFTDSEDGYPTFTPNLPGPIVPGPNV